MFRKIISNLPFSPALVGQLGFYAKRLHKEEVTRRLGLIFVALAIIVQSLTVFQPSESANASSANDMVPGGIGSSIDNYLAPYDANAKYIKDVMNYAGITREEILATKYTTLKVGDILSWGFSPHFSYEDGERQYSITNSNGVQVTTVYSKPLKLLIGPNAEISAWVGYSKNIGWFAINQGCGNLLTKTEPLPPPPPKCIVNSELLANDKNCKPCPGNSTLWISDQACVPNIIKSKNATNTSQGFIDATSVTAKAGDQISYTITIENTGLKPISTKLADNLLDTLEYATLFDNGGGTFNETTGALSWPDIYLSPNDKQTRTFVIRLLDTIPATARGASNETSYDCIITNTFGNSVSVKVDCPTPKVIEKVVTELPKTGPTENLIFAGVILAITAYFYARTRQVKREIRLIRRDINVGTI
jgi:hypothetical protein